MERVKKKKMLYPDTKYDHLTFEFFFPILVSTFHMIVDFKSKPEAFQLKMDHFKIAPKKYKITPNNTKCLIFVFLGGF